MLAKGLEPHSGLGRSTEASTRALTKSLDHVWPRRALEPSQQHEDEDDDENEAEAAGGIVTPAGAVGPRGKGADEEQNQDNEQYRSERHRRLHLKNNGGIFQPQMCAHYTTMCRIISSKNPPVCRLRDVG